MPTDTLDAFHRTLSERGATVEVGDGRPQVLDFGDPAAEHRALAGAAALLDGTSRALVRVEGSRAREMVGGLLTNHVEGLEEGRALYALMLTARGRPVAALRAVALASDHLWLDMPAACREGALEHLGKFLPPRFAQFDLEEGWTRLSVVGPEAAACAGALPAELPEEPLVLSAESEGARLLRRDPGTGAGFDVYLRRDRLEALWAELADAVREVGGGPAGRAAWDVWRVERGVPAYGAEITGEVLPQEVLRPETGWEQRALNHEKGCYTGQEVVAKIHYRGRVNRRLLGLRFEDGAEDPPERGREYYDGDRSRAEVTTGVRSPGLGVVALALVHRDAEAGDELSAEPGGPPACRVAELPLA